jgi:hypothetical protein
MADWQYHRARVIGAERGVARRDGMARAARRRAALAPRPAAPARRPRPAAATKASASARPGTLAKPGRRRPEWRATSAPEAAGPWHGPVASPHKRPEMAHSRAASSRRRAYRLEGVGRQSFQ